MRPPDITTAPGSGAPSQERVSGGSRDGSDCTTFPSPRNRDPLSIARCPRCGELFGTAAAVALHHTGTPAKPRCRNTREMRRRGAWQGFGKVWWTPDLGFPET